MAEKMTDTGPAATRFQIGKTSEQQCDLVCWQDIRKDGKAMCFNGPRNV